MIEAEAMQREESQDSTRPLAVGAVGGCVYSRYW